MGKAQRKQSDRDRALEMGWEFVWEYDPEPYQLGDAEEEMPTEVLRVRLRDPETDETLDSLCGIGDPSDAYARDIENDLAGNAFAIRAAYCVPKQVGLQSTSRAVAARLGRLLTSLDTEITDYVVSGDVATDVRAAFRKIFEGIKNAGWRVRYDDNRQRWVVLPPK